MYAFLTNEIDHQADRQAVRSSGSDTEEVQVKLRKKAGMTEMTTRHKSGQSLHSYLSTNVLVQHLVVDGLPRL